MLSTEAMISTGHYLKRVVINIRASNNISGLVQVSVTSPAGLIKFFLNVEPCTTSINLKCHLMTFTSIFMSVHPLNYSTTVNVNTLACIYKPYFHIQFVLFYMDLVQYKPNSWPEFYLYTSVCIQLIQLLAKS